MIDPDLKTQLDIVNANLIAIKNKKSGGVWRAFFNGMFSALGYVIGLVIVVFILVWALQKTGMWQSFQNEVGNFTNLVNEAEKLLPSHSQPSSSAQSEKTGSGGGETMVTLPNGQ
jgi:hypothetical protein